MDKSFEERMKENGYTDEMLKLDDLMEKLADTRATIKINAIDGKEYIGKAYGYTKADDEEDGFATISVDTGDKGRWCLGVNEIKSIEEVGET